MLLLLIPEESSGATKESIHGFSFETDSERNSGLEPIVQGSTLEDSHSHGHSLITSLSGIRVGLHSELASKSGK